MAQSPTAETRSRSLGRPGESFATTVFGAVFSIAWLIAGDLGSMATDATINDISAAHYRAP
jgi:hypothetical protein